MRQRKAAHRITESLKRDNRVKSVFLKGSMGRDENDEYSDIDLYCLVEEKHLESFLKDRKKHVEVYREIIFYDPENHMEKFKDRQQLRLSEQEYIDAVDDVAFFLLQYKKAADRGNDIWAVKVLNDLLVSC
ncbi:nucleotidyltransferase domain-containing protein [Halobacillus sp. BBL2006]|uniref:nucleotidyltransferase domain-containing protein n=1 Tax=Halobacillus sp. BBL2006 TaxID=1543706 RepID=UPI0006917C4B|nr:nucleotidyltransferase domain-containing protein [Halobacillus sp. BBL2006]